MHRLVELALYPLSAIAILSLLIFVHEMGHFVAARMCGVRVAEFSVGFGREVMGFTDHHGTRWKIGTIQFGGVVRMAGGDETPSRPEEKTVLFSRASLLVRAVVTLAGPGANLAFAIFALALLFAARGERVRSAEITKVLPDTPAAAAGIMPGDKFLTIDGQRIEYFSTAIELIHRHPGDPLTIELQRGRETKTVEVTPLVVPITKPDGNDSYDVRIGVIEYGMDEFVPLPPLRALVHATRAVMGEIGTSVSGFRQIAEGKRPAGQVSGGASMMKETRASFQFGITGVMWVASTLSIGIGFFNLLPIPVLDGGHLVFYAIEAVTRRPPTQRMITYANFAGIFVLMLLALYGMHNDLAHTPLGKYIP